MHKLIFLLLLTITPALLYASPDTDLWSGVSGKGLATIKAALAAGANPNARKLIGGSEKTVLQASVGFGSGANFSQFKTVMTLIKAGADVNAVDSNGESIMYLVVNRNDINQELLELLLLKKPNLNIQNPYSSNRTPLMACAVNADFVQGDHNAAVISLLLNAGADPNIRDSDGKTAADFVRDANVKQLLQSKMSGGGNDGGLKINIPQNIPKFW